MNPSRREPLTPPPGMPPALRAAVEAAVAGGGAVPPPELHFLHRRPDGARGYRRLPPPEGRPQPGEELVAGGEALGAVTGVCTWWTCHSDGGRVKVLVFEVG